MQVTCPQCGARYAVDPAAIGPTGRTVQCVRCSHRWFETVKAAPAASPIPPPDVRPVPDFVIRPQSQYRAGLPAISPPRRTVHWGRWIATAAVLILVVGATAFAWRDEIRDRLPPGWSAFLSLDGASGLFASPVKAMRTTALPEARIELAVAPRTFGHAAPPVAAAPARRTSGTHPATPVSPLRVAMPADRPLEGGPDDL